MKYALPILLTSTLLAAVSLQADTLTIPVGQQASGQQSSLPQRGTSTSAVSQQYGEPLTRHAAVGEPPISRWDYAGFSVYFEHDKVVHSVHQHTPRNN